LSLSRDLVQVPARVSDDHRNAIREAGTLDVLAGNGGAIGIRLERYEHALRWQRLRHPDG
jgi:hypothetical protein